MKTDCDVIRDLLPLYADDACSEKSRELVKEHLDECQACREMLNELRATELESGLRSEKKTVIEYAMRQFRRRSATVGSLVAALIMIPIVLILARKFLNSMTGDWYYTVLASLGVLASVTAVPILMPEDKLFWTFCAFTASLMVLLFVACMYVGGSWFWIASSATLFGLGVAFLPALIHARPVKKLVGSTNKAWVVVGIDLALFLNMLNMIRWGSSMSLRGLLMNPSTLLFSLLLIAGVALVVVEIIRRIGKRK
ncbi:MAG: zf-HC2 domain-containing protein [Clostridia bacterium]|nr:zf-HC2 domain-containing protein [Clostridia bacterium]